MQLRSIGRMERAVKSEGSLILMFSEGLAECFVDLETQSVIKFLVNWRVTALQPNI